MKRLAVCALGVALSSLGSVARADPDRNACFSAHEQAQRLRQTLKLREARAQLLICSRRTCPAMAARDCGEWLDALDKAMPTVVVAARGPDGKDTGAVRVTVDGQTAAEHLDGKAIEIDPGEHVVRYELGGRTREERVIVREGEKGRVLAVDFTEREAPGASHPPPEAPQGGGAPLGAYVLGGVALIGVGGFAGFGVAGWGAVSCRPNCPAAEGARDTMMRDFRIADVSLGVAVVSGALALWLALSASPAEPAASAWRTAATGIRF